MIQELDDMILACEVYIAPRIPDREGPQVKSPFGIQCQDRVS